MEDIYAPTHFTRCNRPPRLTCRSELARERIPRE